MCLALWILSGLVTMVRPGTDGEYGQGDWVSPGTGQNLRFIVIVRDSFTKDMMENFTLALDRADAKGHPYREELRCSDMGIVLVTLSAGYWRFRVYADGYDQEALEGVSVGPGQRASQSTYAWEGIDSFTGTTVAVPIYLRKNTGDKPVINVRPFPEDTVYYAQTDVSPEPIGGIAALRKRVESRRLSEEISAPVNGIMSFVAFINKRGEVVRVDLTQPLEATLDRVAMDAIRGTAFTPGTILGTPVASRLSISLEFTLTPSRGTRR